MGMYLEVDSKGNHLPAKGKLDALLADGATLLPKAEYHHDQTVCVVDNGNFDAAAFTYNPPEMARFLGSFIRGDDRPHTWILATPQQIAANFPPERIEAYRMGS